MIRVEYNNFRPAPMISLIGTILFLLVQASLVHANSANVSATVTVVPRVEALTVSAIPLGSSSIYPGERSVVVLALSVRNTYSEDKSLTSVTIRDASKGLGTPTQLLANLDSLFLFRDSDGDSLLSPADSLMVEAAWDTTAVALNLGDLNIGSDSSLMLLFAVNAAAFPHDGDTADVFLRPSSDIETADATPVTGVDSLNSMGFRIFDGLVASQLNTPSTGLTSMGTGDTVYNVFTVDIPRNGYAPDTLRSFTIHNAGTAEDTDLEFMVLFSDNGNGVWGGFAEENLIAPLEYTGAHWAADNLNTPLSAPTTRFYLGAKALPYPVNGATLILNIPEYGVLMASRNDGPLDTETSPVDTIEIQSEEGLLVTFVSPDTGILIPGEVSEPVFAIELRNGSTDDLELDSLDLQLELIDPTGEGSTADLESQIDSLMLYVDGDGDLRSITQDDQLVATAPAADGSCRFSTGGIQIDASGGEVGLSVVVATNLDFARNGNTVEMSLDSETDLFVTPGTTVFGSFPLTDAPLFTVDAFPANKTAVNNLAPRNIYGGQSNIPVLDCVVPGNGYADDTLRSLLVENIGSVDDDIAIEAIELWRDQLEDGFTADDILVATLTRGGIYWSATGFSQFVASGGQRMILTVDISDDQFEGGTLVLSIPGGGMTYASGMVGPDDEAISDISTHLIIPPQRITVVSVPTASTTVRPGRTKNTLLTFAIYNGYINETKTLQTLRFSNITRSVSDADFADHEVGRLRLYYDADANRMLDGDPLVGSGYFQDGVLVITGLNLGLSSESLAYFFVQSDLAVDAIDSDSLGISIAGLADIGFQETVSINGDLPLTSGGWHIIDGSVKCQYEILSVASRSINPGETLIPLMSFRPASNGDQVDTLMSVSLANTGSADSSDITDLKLWLDSNGDDTWQITDALLGNFTYAGSWWGCGGFEMPVTPDAPTLFVTGDVQPGATQGRTVSLEVPVMGCLYGSGNDGPIDSTLPSETHFAITGSNLRIAEQPGSSSYSVGQNVEVAFSATNLSASAMDSVIGLCTLLGDLASVQLDSVSLGPVALAAADSAVFAAYYTAVQPGTISWSVQAIELVTDDSSSELFTEPVLIQSAPTHVDIDFVSSMPATVTLGQRNIIPITLGLLHGDAISTAASAVLDSVSLEVYDGDGTPLAADDVFARVRIITDDMQVAEADPLPTSHHISFVFDDPIVVEPGNERSLSAVVDIDSLATATEFLLAVSSESSVVLRDCNSGAIIPVSTMTGFPLMTTVGRIEHPPDQLLVAAPDQTDRGVNLDQDGAQLISITVRHPGVTGTAPIQLTGLSVSLEDDAYQALDFSQVFEAVKAVHQGDVLAMLSGGSLNAGTVTLSLSSPPILGPGATETIELLVNVRSDAQLRQVRLFFADSSKIAARNYSTGETVPVNLDPTVMPPEATYPLYSGWIQLHYPAQAPLVCLSSSSNASFLAGADSVSLMTMVLTYPSTDEFSSVRLQNMSLFVLDTTDLALDPRKLFDRIGYIEGSSPAQYQTSVDPVNGQTVFEFGASGITIDPSDTVTIQLVADLDAGVPYDHFLLRFGALEALALIDATDTSRHLEAVIDDQCACSVPFVAGPIGILWPAGRPTLRPESLPLTLAAAGQQNIQIFDAYVDYNSLIPRGDLLLESLTGEIQRRTADGPVPVSGSTVFGSVRLKINNETWANDSSLISSTTLLWSSSDYRLEAGNSARLQLEVDIKTGAAPGNYVLAFADSTFIDFIDENVDTLLYPVLASGSYPLLSAELSIGAADLTGSFTNFPNPFIPSRDEGITTFGYFLSEDAYVDICIYTSTGELTATLVNHVRKAAGTHDEDTWDGRNDRNLAVAPGTYLCVITARYDSGRQEQAKRKVTVIR